jgi:glycosyltransferase involved in cell wall biosynthesis
MKVYEYLAAGLPVVASPLPSLDGVGEVVVAEGVSETVAALERLLAADSPAARRSRSESAQGHSWDARLAEIDEAVSRCLT